MARFGFFALLIFAMLSFGILLPSIYACGCGIAISDIKVFNALKETQAYLLIDVKDNSTYDEMPFFRFVSMDEPYNVTIVFPMDQIPANVDGKKMTAGDFLENYGINSAEEVADEQDFGLLVKKAGKYAFAFSNGFFGLISFTMSGAALDGKAGVAHFEFEGGSLDIYNVSSMQSLEEFAREANITLTGEVEELVNRYKDYYIAVLYLSVPTVISEDKINTLEECMPEGIDRVRVMLESKAEFSRNEIDRIVQSEISNSSCPSSRESDLREYMNFATMADDRVEGTLVIMQFQGSPSFFYPTSVVNSYKYPVTDQKYYVKVPNNLDVKLSSSWFSRISNSEGYRWYKVGSTQNDLKGTIVESNVLTKLQDGFRAVVMGMQAYAGWFSLAILVFFFVAPLVVWSHSEKVGVSGTFASIGAFLVGGFLFAAFVVFLMKKRKLAATFVIAWAILLICTL